MPSQTLLQSYVYSHNLGGCDKTADCSERSSWKSNTVDGVHRAWALTDDVLLEVDGGVSDVQQQIDVIRRHAGPACVRVGRFLTRQDTGF